MGPQTSETDVDRFVSGKIWAIARMGDASARDVCKVEEKRLNALSFDEAQDKYTEAAGEMAGDTLRVTLKAKNLGKWVTKGHFLEATMAFMEKGDVFNTQHANCFDIAANIRLEDKTKQVYRLVKTSTPTGAAQKYLITFTDVFLLNYAVSLDEACYVTQANAQGMWLCILRIESLPL